MALGQSMCEERLAEVTFLEFMEEQSGSSEWPGADEY